MDAPGAAVSAVPATERTSVPRFFRRCPRHHLELIEVPRRGPGLAKDQPLLGCPGPAHVPHVIAPWEQVTHWEVYDRQLRRVVTLANYYGTRDVDPRGRHEPLPDAPEYGARRLPGQRRSDAKPRTRKGERGDDYMPTEHVLHV